MDTVAEAEINYFKSTGEGQDWLRPFLAENVHSSAFATSQDYRCCVVHLVHSDMFLLCNFK
jgi:hypothetical protein